MAINNTTALEELLAAPVRSIGRAQQALEFSNIHQLTALMEETADGSYRPRTIAFEIVQPGKAPTQVLLPLIALVTLPQLLIDDAAVSMNAGVRYRMVTDKSGPRGTKSAGKGISGTRLMCELLPEKPGRDRRTGPSMKISLSVQRRPTSEAVRQLQDRLVDRATRGD